MLGDAAGKTLWAHRATLLLVAALLMAAVTASVATVLWYALPAQAQSTPNTITVTSADDAGAGSLRQAILDANASTGVADTIDFAPSLSGQTISLASDLPSITDPAGLTIDGGSADITVYGLIFLPNGDPKRLRAFGVGGGANLTVNGIKVNNSSMPVNSGSELTVSDSTFSQVRVFDESSGGKLTVRDSEFSESAVFFDDAEIILDKLTMTTQSQIDLLGSKLTVRDSDFSESGVFVYDSETTLDNLTMTKNLEEEEFAALEIHGGTLTVRDSTFSQNRNAWYSGDGGFLGEGGAIYNGGGTLTVSDSTFSNNLAASGGGGIFNDGTLTVSNSFFRDNKEDWLRFNGGFGSGFCFVCGGGGIYNHGTATVSNSTFSRNASGSGGGIFNDGTLKVSNSTFSDNLSGGDIYNFTGLDYFGVLRVSNSTFFNGGGIIIDPGSSATLRNTIVAAGCDGTITNGGHNLDSGTSCGFDAANNSLSGVDPLLGPLADNGGPTQTHALLEGSPAIDKGNSFGATTDQRGVARPQGTAADIGAFEVDVAPTVNKATPTGSRVAPKANVVAVFSEPMDPTTVSKRTFTLKKGTTTVAAKVTLDSTGKQAVLNPTKNLQAGAKYKATVTTQVKDLWGTAHDQDPNTEGNQPKTWTFKVKR